MKVTGNGREAVQCLICRLFHLVDILDAIALSIHNTERRVVLLSTTIKSRFR